MKSSILRAMKKIIIISSFSLTALLGITSCNDKESTYIVPHEKAQTVVSLKTLSTQSKQVSWVAPKHWKELPSSDGIRTASFEITKNNQNASLTITSFPGQTGGLLQNINRWRTQLSLEPITLKKISSIVSTKSTPSIEYDLIKLNNPKQNSAMTVAIIRHQGKSWFIKLTGDLKLVNQEINTFEAFLETMKFGL